MYRVSIEYHNTGDHVVISEVPWWKEAIERVANALFCPCCGISGFLSRWGRYCEISYRIWGAILGWTWKKQHELIRFPIECGCIAARALWEDGNGCWRENCPVELAKEAQ